MTSADLYALLLGSSVLPGDGAHEMGCESVGSLLAVTSAKVGREPTRNAAGAGPGLRRLPVIQHAEPRRHGRRLPGEGRQARLRHWLWGWWSRLARRRQRRARDRAQPMA
jgi:hypothetical protein